MNRLSAIREVITFLWSFLHKRQQYNIYRDLLKRQKSSYDEISKRQFEALRNIVEYSYENVPYYREVIQGSDLLVDGQLQFNSTNDMQALSVLHKDIIRGQGEKMYSPSHKSRHSYLNTSGGSTGSPVIVLQDQYFFVFSQACFWLITGWRKAKFYSSNFYLWGASRDQKAGWKNVIAKLVNNVTFVNSSKLSADDKKAIINRLNENPPGIIIAYAQSIYELACFASEKNLKLTKQNLVHSGAGMMYDHMRTKVEDVFQCKVFDHYGGREMGPIASECSAHEGLHILSDHVYIEILDKDDKPCPDGVEGEVVVTTLTNLSMPLIRYRSGDLAVKMPYKRCSCGVNYPKLSQIVGRTSDNLLTINDETISGEYLTLSYNFVPGIENFQIVQLELEHIQIKLVVNSEYSNKESEFETGKKMRELFGENLKLEFIYVADIEKTSTGKHRFTINKLA